MLRDKIRQQYRVRLILDNLPITTYDLELDPESGEGRFHLHQQAALGAEVAGNGLAGGGGRGWEMPQRYHNHRGGWAGTQGRVGSGPAGKLAAGSHKSFTVSVTEECVLWVAFVPQKRSKRPQSEHETQCRRLNAWPSLRARPRIPHLTHHCSHTCTCTCTCCAVRPGYEVGYQVGDKYFINNHLMFKVLVHETHGQYTMSQMDEAEVEAAAAVEVRCLAVGTTLLLRVIGRPAAELVQLLPPPSLGGVWWSAARCSCCSGTLLLLVSRACHPASWEQPAATLMAVLPIIYDCSHLVGRQ